MGCGAVPAGPRRRRRPGLALGPGRVVGGSQSGVRCFGLSCAHVARLSLATWGVLGNATLVLGLRSLLWIELRSFEVELRARGACKDRPRCEPGAIYSIALQEIGRYEARPSCPRRCGTTSGALGLKRAAVARTWGDWPFSSYWPSSLTDTAPAGAPSQFKLSCLHHASKSIPFAFVSVCWGSGRTCAAHGGWYAGLAPAPAALNSLTTTHALSPCPPPRRRPPRAGAVARPACAGLAGV